MLVGAWACTLPKAALAAGHQVVATGRNTDKVVKAFGQSDQLLVVKLDVTSTSDAEAAAKATIDRFGRIDVLVNNAASVYAGYFEELSQRQMDPTVGDQLGWANERDTRLPAFDA